MAVVSMSREARIMDMWSSRTEESLTSEMDVQAEVFLHIEVDYLYQWRQHSSEGTQTFFPNSEQNGTCHCAKINYLSLESTRASIFEILLNINPIDQGSCQLLSEHIATSNHPQLLSMVQEKPNNVIIFVELEVLTTYDCNEGESFLKNFLINGAEAIDQAVTESIEERGFNELPASQASVEALETKKFARGGALEESCTVCLEGFLTGMEVTKMPCSHIFHGECIIQWLKQRDSCPNCRFGLPI